MGQTACVTCDTPINYDDVSEILKKKVCPIRAAQSHYVALLLNGVETGIHSYTGGRFPSLADYCPKHLSSKELLS